MGSIDMGKQGPDIVGSCGPGKDSSRYLNF